MTDWARWLAVLFIWAGTALPGFSQALAAGSPRPPAFGVMDDGGFFSKDSGTLKRITDHIRELESAHGYKIYLVVEPVLIAATAPERAIELQNAWVPDGNGLVVVFESDSRSLGIGRDMNSVPGKKASGVRVPSHETNAILNRAMEGMSLNQSPELSLDTLVANLTSGFDSYFKSLKEPPPAARNFKIGMVVLGLACLLGLGVILFGSLVRHSGISGVVRFRLPSADSTERLGAPCGASVTTRKFRTPNS